MIIYNAHEKQMHLPLSNMHVHSAGVGGEISLQFHTRTQ